jgi:hypothetical protein
MKPRPTCLIVLAAFALGGCSTITTPEKGVIVTEDQTEVITPVGSHIRTRVIKGQTPLTASPVETVSGERLNDSLLTRDGSIPQVPVR